MENFKINTSNNDKSVLKTIRLKLSLLKKLEDLSMKNNVSVNKLINECIEYALNNLETDNNN